LKPLAFICYTCSPKAKYLVLVKEAYTAKIILMMILTTAILLFSLYIPAVGFSHLDAAFCICDKQQLHLRTYRYISTLNSHILFETLS
jgi:hypothetical protein